MRFIQDTIHAILFEPFLAGKKMTIRRPYFWLINEHLSQFSPKKIAQANLDEYC